MGSGFFFFADVLNSGPSLGKAELQVKGLSLTGVLSLRTVLKSEATMTYESVKPEKLDKLV